MIPIRSHGFSPSRWFPHGPVRLGVLAVGPRTTLRRRRRAPLRSASREGGTVASRGVRGRRREMVARGRARSLDSLPLDVLFVVFSRLTGNDVLRAACACRPWREALAPVLQRRHAALTSRARVQLDASDPSAAASPGDRWFRRFALDACVACRRARAAFDFEYRNPNSAPRRDAYQNDPDANTTAGEARAPTPGPAGLTVRGRYCRECASRVATEETRAWATLRVRPAR